jgi:hypothetical protein
LLKEKLYKICQGEASFLLFQQNVIAKVFSSVNIWTEKQIKKETERRKKERETKKERKERKRSERY